ncbi:MAG: hypothetical protein KAT34_14400 [Candidatus Aminicenantes bacterium]|nr:hypothetical protein [Candidatus Aminicenantes bacterium]
MFKKELRDTMKILGHSLFFLIALPILYRGFGYSGVGFSLVFRRLFTIIVVFFAAYAGAGLFLFERKEKAFEYLFSLPLPRFKIILNKLLPRLLVLSVLFITGVFFRAFADIPADCFGLLFLFLSAMFIGLAVNSVILGLLGILTVNLLFYYSSMIINYLAIEKCAAENGAGFLLSLLLPGLLLLVPLGTAFRICFGNMDVKPLEMQVKPYIRIVLPPVLVLIVFVVAFFKSYFYWVKTY